MTVRGGDLRQRIKIERATVVQDAHNQEIETWTELARSWAFIEPLQGREFFEGRTVLGDTSARIKMRYRTDLRKTDRIVDLETSDVWEAEAILDVDSRRRELEIVAVRRG